MRKLLLALIACLAWGGNAFAVPENVSLRVTDVTTSSFALVWMTDVAATPAVEVYSDSGMANPLTETVSVTAMPDVNHEVASAARSKGVMKVRVSGLSSNTNYYARAVTVDPADAANIGYSALQEITTAAVVTPYREEVDGTLRGFANDLAPLKVYIRPSDSDAVPGLGDLILMETPGSPYPESAFVGAGIPAPEGVIDLNNLFGTEMTSLFIQGGEKAVFSVYRGGDLSTLVHYRRLGDNSTDVSVVAPITGFFADINLDGNVDDLDFQLLRGQYRTSPNDPNYNPDYKFVADPNGTVDARDFALFAREYGRNGVQ